MGIHFWKKTTEYVIISNSKIPHSISVGYTEEKRRNWPQDTICIKLASEKKEDKFFHECQMTPDEALIIASGLIKLVDMEMEGKKKKEFVPEAKP